MAAQEVWRENADGKWTCSTDPTETFADPDTCCFIVATAMHSGEWPSFGCDNIRCGTECDLSIEAIEWGNDGHATGYRIRCNCPESQGE